MENETHRNAGTQNGTASAQPDKNPDLHVNSNQLNDDFYKLVSHRLDISGKFVRDAKLAIKAANGAKEFTPRDWLDAIGAIQFAAASITECAAKLTAEIGNRFPRRGPSEKATQIPGPIEAFESAKLIDNE